MSEFSRDGGAMGRAIRSFDWAKTPLGPLESWPTSLKTVVQMMLHQQHAICLFWGPELTLLYNDAYKPFLGKKEHRALGTPFRIIWSDVWEDVKPFANEALAGRGTFIEDMRLVMDRNGYDEETYWTFSYSPLHDDDGNVAGLIDVAIDTTFAVQMRRLQLERAAAQDVLRQELVHRVKNTMSVVAAVVTASIRHAHSLEEARETITQRIAALGKAQGLLAMPDDYADMEYVVREALASHLDSPHRATVSGPSVSVSSQQAVGISLAIYELATNAAKYGALSNDRGSISIDWEVFGDHEFSFVWQEREGPVVNPPTRMGFGSRLTNQIVAAYFSGKGETTYGREGVRFKLIGRLVSVDEAARGKRSGAVA